MSYQKVNIGDTGQQMVDKLDNNFKSIGGDYKHYLRVKGITNNIAFSCILFSDDNTPIETVQQINAALNYMVSEGYFTNKIGGRNTYPIFSGTALGDSIISFFEEPSNINTLGIYTNTINAINSGSEYNFTPDQIFDTVF